VPAFFVNRHRSAVSEDIRVSGSVEAPLGVFVVLARPL
jgi:hypothetical protein